MRGFYTSLYKIRLSSGINTKFSRLERYLYSLTYGATLCAL